MRDVGKTGPGRGKLRDLISAKLYTQGQEDIERA
jgi:hypothetical protein